MLSALDADAAAGLSSTKFLSECSSVGSGVAYCTGFEGCGACDLRVRADRPRLDGRYVQTAPIEEHLEHTGLAPSHFRCLLRQE